MTVWLNVRVGSRSDSVADDLSALLAHESTLDQIAEQLQVDPLTMFFDDIDVRYNMDELGEFEESDDGWPVEAAKWHDPRSVLKTVSAIRIHLLAHPDLLEEIDGWPQESVIQDIDRLIRGLQKAESDSNSVHLLLVM